MNGRRSLARLVTAVFVLGILLTAGRARCGDADDVAFVRALYEKQARDLAANVPMSNAEFTALFSARMQQLMRAPRYYPPNEPIGPILDAFFGWGVLPSTDVRIGAVTRLSGSDGGPATIAVELVHHGGPHQAYVSLVRDGATWRIDDVSYDHGMSLIEHYRRHTKQ